MPAVQPDLEALVARWRGPLTGLLLAWGTPAGEAADLAQDVLAEAFLGRERFAGDVEDLEAWGRWLRGIARNLHAGWRRGRRDVSLETEPPEARPEPEDPRAEALRAAIEKLPDELREAVQVHYLEQTSVRATASLLGVSEKTVEGRLYRARKELARRVAAGVERTGETAREDGGRR